MDRLKLTEILGFGSKTSNFLVFGSVVVLDFFTPKLTELNQYIYIYIYVPAEMTYSSGDMIIALQEVLSRSLQFHNGVYSELPDSIKYIIDNLYAAFTRSNHSLFEKTLQALEIHLVNLTAQNEASISYANLISEKILAPENDLISNLVPGNILISEK